MRIDVKKFLFIGNHHEKADFFKNAQKMGVVHFINPGAAPSKDVPLDVQQVSAAIKVLRGQPVVEQEENYSLLNVNTIVEEILRLNRDNESLLEQLRVLKLEMSRVEIFGNFSKEDVNYLEQEGHRTVQFFCAKENFFKEIPCPDELLYVGSNYGLDYYMAINEKPVAYEKMIEIKIDQPLGVLKERYQEAQGKQRETERRLKGYAKYNDFLHASLISKLNYYHLYTAQSYVQYALDETVFAVEGWVPENKLDELHHLTDQMDIHCEEIAIEETDVIPTYLENKGLSRLGEDLVHIYDVPSAKDKDPSAWVLGAFALFFAFIIGDAGYGLIYLGIALFLRYKYPDLKGMSKRILNLFTLLSVGCVIWGVMTASFFGMSLAPHNPLRKISIIHWLVEKKAEYLLTHQNADYQEWIQKHPGLAEATTPQEFIRYESTKDGSTVVLDRLTNHVMFEFALFVGIVHLALSLIRYSGRNWQNLGWLAFLIGAYLYFPYHLDVPGFLNFAGGVDLVKGGVLGLQLMIGGILFAWIASIFINGWTGLFEIMTVVQVFADVLSYLRLYALGLAGAIVAVTINEMAASVPAIIAILLTLISHAVNIVLGTMSGVIHGLRLNFLEWYHYSFEGGGKIFSPLKLLKKE